jgi:hypothetical protein
VESPCFSKESPSKTERSRGMASFAGIDDSWRDRVHSLIYACVFRGACVVSSDAVTLPFPQPHVSKITIR